MEGDLHSMTGMLQKKVTKLFLCVQAASIGAGNQAAQAMLRSEYRDGLCLEEAKAIARRVLEKTMDSVALTGECVELLYLTRESETVCIKELALP